MTLGQRIAQKRKELGISQENLGERLGVSRQAIYKWESDSAMPEVEKLVALSGLFGVSVGWLLGTEEEPTAPEELTEAQLKMVEEIVGRYLPSKPKRGRWWLAVGGVAVCLLVGNLYQRLGDLTRQSEQLQRAVSQVETSVNRQIGGISSQVEDILKAQNDLTSDYGAEFLSVDLGEGVVTFALRARPKTYVPGMEALFLVDCGVGQALEFPALRGEDGVYRVEAAFPLTDTRVLSVVFVSPDGTRATQLMESYGYYLYESLPYINLNDGFMYERVSDLEEIRLTDHSRYVWWREEATRLFGAEGPARVEEIRIGFFQNGTLLFWAENLEEQPATFQGDWGDNHFAAFPDDVTFSATAEDRFTVAAFVRDSCGRVYAQTGPTYGIEEHPKQGMWFIWADDTVGNGSVAGAVETDADDPLTWDYPKDDDGWPLN